MVGNVRLTGMAPGTHLLNILLDNMNERKSKSWLINLIGMQTEFTNTWKIVCKKSSYVKWINLVAPSAMYIITRRRGAW